MLERLRAYWPLIKTLFAVTLLLVIGRRFYLDLTRLDLQEHALRPGWLVLAGVLYLAGLGLSAVFWYRLLKAREQKPQLLGAARAYYLGHLGKYLPGKAWALLLRATLAGGAGVNLKVAGMTSLYEVLTTMASGVALALILYAAQVGDFGTLIDGQTWPRLLALLRDPVAAGLTPKDAFLLSAVLLVPVGLPLLPAFWNRFIRLLAHRFQSTGDLPASRLRHVTLLEGLALTAVGWLLLGASTWAVVQSLTEQTVPWNAGLLGQVTAAIGLAYVTGFVIIFMPSGLGVREFFLTLLLAPILVASLELPDARARPLATLAVLVLRLTWTAAELVVAGFLYWLPGRAPALPRNSPVVEPAMRPVDGGSPS